MSQLLNGAQRSKTRKVEGMKKEGIDLGTKGPKNGMSYLFDAVKIRRRWCK